MAFVAGGSFPASITPMAQQVTVQGNYLDFNNLAVSQWAQQYLPELYEQEVERYGNRTLSGFLRMVGAEMPMTSDQVIWSEQNRLHVAYDNVACAANTLTITLTLPATTSALKLNQTVVVEQTLNVRNDHEITGFCFTPQDGNSILSSVAAAEWFLYPHSYKDKIQCFSKFFFDRI